MKKILLTLTVLALLFVVAMAAVWPPKKTTIDSDKAGSFLRIGGTKADTTAVIVTSLEEFYTDIAYEVLGDSTGLTKAAGGVGADTIPDSVTIQILLQATLDTSHIAAGDSVGTWLNLKTDTLTKVGTGFPRLNIAAGKLVPFVAYRYILTGLGAATNDSMNWKIKTYWSNTNFSH